MDDQSQGGWRDMLNTDDEDFVTKLVKQYYGQGARPQYPDPGKQPSPQVRTDALDLLRRRQGAPAAPQQTANAPMQSPADRARTQRAMQQAMMG